MTWCWRGGNRRKRVFRVHPAWGIGGCPQLSQTYGRRWVCVRDVTHVCVRDMTHVCVRGMTWFHRDCGIVGSSAVPVWMPALGMCVGQDVGVCVWHDSCMYVRDVTLLMIICEAWRICVCVWRDSCMCDCDMARLGLVCVRVYTTYVYACVWHDSCMCVCARTRLMCMRVCDMTHVCVCATWHNTSTCVRQDACVCVIDILHQTSCASRAWHMWMIHIPYQNKNKNKNKNKNPSSCAMRCLGVLSVDCTEHVYSYIYARIYIYIGICTYRTKYTDKYKYT